MSAMHFSPSSGFIVIIVSIIIVIITSKHGQLFVYISNETLVCFFYFLFLFFYFLFYIYEKEENYIKRI